QRGVPTRPATEMESRVTGGIFKTDDILTHTNTHTHTHTQRERERKRDTHTHTQKKENKIPQIAGELCDHLQVLNHLTVYPEQWRGRISYCLIVFCAHIV